MEQIIPGLYISNAPIVRKLPADHDFDEVVTLGYLDMFGYDCPEASTTGDRFVFPDGPHDYITFASAVKYVLNAIENDKKTVVHCQAGVSRSGGVTAVVVSEHLDIPLEDALTKVRDARHVVNPEPEIRDSMRRYTDDSLSADETRPR